MRVHLMLDIICCLADHQCQGKMPVRMAYRNMLIEYKKVDMCKTSSLPLCSGQHIGGHNGVQGVRYGWTHEVNGDVIHKI